MSETPETQREPIPGKNVIEKIDYYLGFKGLSALEQLYGNLFTNNDYLDSGQRQTSLSSLSAFLRYFQMGAKYDNNKFGAHILPLNLIFEKRYFVISTTPYRISDDVCSYIPELNAIGFTAKFIATIAKHYGTNAVMPLPYLPKGRGVRLEDFTKLAGAEECYHSYQDKVLKMRMDPTILDRTHPLEQGVRTFLGEIVNRGKLGVTTYPA